MLNFIGCIIFDLASLVCTKQKLEVIGQIPWLPGGYHLKFKGNRVRVWLYSCDIKQKMQIAISES